VELGDAHYYGRGTGVDPQRAYYCYQQAANLSGNAEALEKMAFMRSLGLVGEEAISNQS
jgi:TPR repeat protein